MNNNSALSNWIAAVPRSPQTPFAERQNFGAKDFTFWIEDIPVGNIQSLTISTQRETAQEYAMGSDTSMGTLRGKRVIVASMVLLQKDRDALMYEVFQLHKKKQLLASDLWSTESPASRFVRTSDTTTLSDTGQTIVSGYRTGTGPDPKSQQVSGSDKSNTLINMSPAQLDASIERRQRLTAEMASKMSIDYLDQLPPFNMTIIGLNSQGEMFYQSLFGLEASQHTFGFSANDLMTPVTAAFTLRGFKPATPLSADARTLTSF